MECNNEKSKFFLRKGNCYLFWKSDGNYVFSIGPEWYISTLGMILTFIIGLIILHFLFEIMGEFSKYLYLFFFVSIILLYIYLALSNPGIYVGEKNVIFDEISCFKCNTPISLKAYHCDDCDVCVEHYDHHCIWIGKCVGKNNIEFFYLFGVSIPLFFIFVIILSGLLDLDKQ